MGPAMTMYPQIKTQPPPIPTIKPVAMVMEREQDSKQAGQPSIVSIQQQFQKLSIEDVQKDKCKEFEAQYNSFISQGQALHTKIFSTAATERHQFLQAKQDYLKQTQKIRAQLMSMSSISGFPQKLWTLNTIAHEIYSIN